MSEDADDARELREVSRDLPALDVDAEAAARIARAARRGRPRHRVVEAVLVAVLVTGFLAWALYMVWAAFS
ncbi:MAG TPA: hypothetical protein VGF94_24900 [Kofleriaceae bacterium]|jgi:hypothetical protein